jgi:hypothetical protein
MLFTAVLFLAIFILRGTPFVKPELFNYTYPYLQSPGGGGYIFAKTNIV